MSEPLFEFLRNPAPLSLSSQLVGNAVLLIVAGMSTLALLVPLLRGFALTVGIVRRLTQGVGGRSSTWVGDPNRPLRVEGLSPTLARLARQTRTLALELRRRSSEARHWPEDVAEVELVRVRWWSSLVSESIALQPLLDTRRDVFDWLDSVACLPTGDRQRLSDLGVDIEAVRSTLTADRAVAESIPALAGLLWTIDEQLAGAASSGYRASGARPAANVGLGCRPSDDDETHARQRRFSSVVVGQARGLSRLASSYAKTPSEREDLEQDIALALWQALPQFRGESSVETFAYRVARYCCFRHLRRRAKRRGEADLEELAAIGEPGDPDSCPESWLAHGDELARVKQARAELPDSLEATLSLHLAGLSYAEIAERLGISEQNVSVRLTRARHKLRDQLVAA